MKTHQEIREAIDKTVAFHVGGSYSQEIADILHALNDRISAHVNVQDERIAELEETVANLSVRSYNP